MGDRVQRVNNHSRPKNLAWSKPTMDLLTSSSSSSHSSSSTETRMEEVEAEEGEESEEDVRIISSSLELMRHSNCSSLSKIIPRLLDPQTISNLPLFSGSPLPLNKWSPTIPTSTQLTLTPLAQEIWAT